MLKHGGSWFLHYVKSMYAITDVPAQVHPSPCLTATSHPNAHPPRSPNSSPNTVDGSTAPSSLPSTQQSTSTTSTTHPTLSYIKHGSTSRWCINSSISSFHGSLSPTITLCLRSCQSRWRIYDLYEGAFFRVFEFWVARIVATELICICYGCRWQHSFLCSRVSRTSPARMGP